MQKMFYDLVNKPKHLYNALVKSTARVLKTQDPKKAADRNVFTVDS